MNVHRYQIRQVLGHAAHSQSRQDSRNHGGRGQRNHRPLAIGNRFTQLMQSGRRMRGGGHPGVIAPSDPREVDHEAIFEKFYKRFMKQVNITLSFLGIIFLILLITTQIIKDDFEDGVYTLQGCLGLYILYVLRKDIFNPNRARRGKVGYKVLVVIVYILFLLTIKDGDPKGTDSFGFFIALSVLIIVNYLVSMVVSFFSNSSSLEKICELVNRKVLFCRFIIFLQMIFLLVQMCIGQTLSWFIVFIPIWGLTVNLFLIIWRLFYQLHQGSGVILKKSLDSSKLKGLIWVFGVLGEASLLMFVVALIATLKMDYSEWFDEADVAFLVLYLIGFVLCAITLVYTQYYKDDIFETVQEVRIILNMGIEEATAAITEIQEARKTELEQKEKEEKSSIKYVVKLSNSYFKGLTKDEFLDHKRKNKRRIWSILIRSNKNVKEEIGSPEHSVIQVKEETEKPNCLICFAKYPDAVLMNCGHGGICYDCGAEMIQTKKECHMCRKEVALLLKIKTLILKQSLFKVTHSIEVKH